MDTRRFVCCCAAGLGLVGLAAVVVPLWSSMQPTPRAVAALPRFDLSQVAPGGYTLIEHPLPKVNYNGYNQALFVIRFRDGTFRAWEVPTIHGKVGMPDIHWWRPFFACNEFGPAIVDGEIDEASRIECRDSTLPDEWWRSVWRWDLEGKSVGTYPVDDMKQANGVIEGKRYFVLGMRS